MECYSHYEQELYDKNGQQIGWMAVLFGGMNSLNPKGFMDLAVHDYLQKHGNPLHNQFVEIHLDNPWLRVLVVGINELPYDEDFFEF